MISAILQFIILVYGMIILTIAFRAWRDKKNSNK